MTKITVKVKILFLLCYRRYEVEAWVVGGYSTKVLSRYRHANCYILIRTRWKISRGITAITL